MLPDWVAILVSVFALAIGVVTYMLGSKMTKGQVELQIRELISSAKRHFNEMCVARCDQEQLQGVVNSAWEDVLNAYDEACKKYLDKKVDRKSFKQMYQDEIRQLVEDDNFKQYHSNPQSRYRYILRVYEEWRS